MLEENNYLSVCYVVRWHASHPFLLSAYYLFHSWFFYRWVFKYVLSLQRRKSWKSWILVSQIFNGDNLHQESKNNNNIELSWLLNSTFELVLLIPFVPHNSLEQDHSQSVIFEGYCCSQTNGIDLGLKSFHLK